MWKKKTKQTNVNTILQKLGILLFSLAYFV